MPTYHSQRAKLPGSVSDPSTHSSTGLGIPPFYIQSIHSPCPVSLIQSILPPLTSMSASETQELWALPDAKYHHRIIDLKKQVISLASQPDEWMQAVFMQWLGIRSPHIWQIENSLDLCQGLDVFLTVRMGSGKSALTLAPMIACHLRNRLHVAIGVYPMEALMSDQVSTESFGESHIYL